MYAAADVEEATGRGAALLGLAAVEGRPTEQVMACVPPGFVRVRAAATRAGAQALRRRLAAYYDDYEAAAAAVVRAGATGACSRCC